MKNKSRITKHKSTGENIGSLWQRVVRRRSFLKGIGMAGVTLSAGGLLVTEGKAKMIAQTIQGTKLSPGDAALLKFAAWVEKEFGPALAGETIQTETASGDWKYLPHTLDNVVKEYWPTIFKRPRREW